MQELSDYVEWKDDLETLKFNLEYHGWKYIDWHTDMFEHLVDELQKSPDCDAKYAFFKHHDIAMVRQRHLINTKTLEDNQRFWPYQDTVSALVCKIIDGERYCKSADNYILVDNAHVWIEVPLLAKDVPALKIYRHKDGEKNRINVNGVAYIQAPPSSYEKEAVILSWSCYEEKSN